MFSIQGLELSVGLQAPIEPLLKKMLFGRTCEGTLPPVSLYTNLEEQCSDKVRSCSSEEGFSMALTLGMLLLMVHLLELRLLVLSMVLLIY